MKLQHPEDPRSRYWLRTSDMVGVSLEVAYLWYWRREVIGALDFFCQWHNFRYDELVIFVPAWTSSEGTFMGHDVIIAANLIEPFAIGLRP